MRHDPRVSIVALAVAAGTAVVLWLMGSRFAKGHVARYGRRAGPLWLFRQVDDPELESMRRIGLLVLPFLVVGAAVYVLTSTPT